MQGLDQSGVDLVKIAASGIEPAQILDMVGGVIFRHQADGLGLHPQVDILGDEDVAARAVLLGQVITEVKDLMVRF